MTILDVAEHQGVGYVDLASLAKVQKINRAVLEKTVRLLQKGQLLDSHLGCEGGYRVSRPLSEISLADVYEVVRGRIELSPCMKDQDCPGCQMKNEWEKINGLIWVMLQGVKLDGLSYDCRNYEDKKSDSLAELAWQTKQ